jgi:hypothetical protein
MKKYINNLRQKSEHEKSRTAFWGASIVTGVIVLFWLMAATYDGEQEKSEQLANPASLVNEYGQRFADEYIDNTR